MPPNLAQPPHTSGSGSPALRVRYMGSKHDLAPSVAAVVGETGGDRPFLDLFCGMCSVGGAVAPSGRPVWGNDVQWSASMAAHCLLATENPPTSWTEVSGILEVGFRRNQARLRRRFREFLAEEAHMLAEPDTEAFSRAAGSWQHVGNDARLAAEAKRLARQPDAFPYRLFALTFAWGYFGLAQAIDIDSIRYALDDAKRRRLIDAEQARWGVLALMQAASCIASTPGHFAQYLRATNDRSLGRVAAQRRRCVWSQFRNEWSLIHPYGTSGWRSGNRTMRRDVGQIWPELRKRGFKSGVIYADPPYSKDHYSRYYHVLETLVRYDYPASSGAGRYRPDRFVTPFSLTTKVMRAFDSLFRGAAATDSVMLLSYPTNGLVSGKQLEAMLRSHFGEVDLVLCKRTNHSTLGARHGAATSQVHELVYMASRT